MTSIVVEELPLEGASLIKAPDSVSSEKTSHSGYELVKLNQLAFGKDACVHSHDFDKISQRAKGKLEEAFSKVFKDRRTRPYLKNLGSKTDFHYDLTAQGLSIRFGKDPKNALFLPFEQLIDLKKDDPFYQVFRSLKQIQGSVLAIEAGNEMEQRLKARKRADDKIEKLYRKVHEERSRDIEKEEKSLKGRTLQVGSPTREWFGFVWNILRGISSIGRHHPVVLTHGMLSGALGGITGGLILNEGYRMRKEASEVEDVEGVRMGHSQELLGSMMVMSGIDLAISNTASLAHASHVASAATIPLIPLYGGVSAAALFYGLYGLKKAQVFKRKLDEILDNSSLSPKEKVRSVLNFLHRKISLNEWEKMEIRTQIEKRFPHISGKEKDEKLQEEIEKVLKRKRLRLERRIGVEMTNEVMEKLMDLRKGIEDPKTEKQCMLDAKDLIHKVEVSNYKQNVRFAMIVLVGILGLITAVTFFTVGGITPILMMAFCSAIWFAIEVPTITDAIGAAVHRMHQTIISHSDPIPILQRDPAVRHLEKEFYDHVKFGYTEENMIDDERAAP